MKSGVSFGIDQLLKDSSLQAELQGKRVALLGHPASVDAQLVHSLDRLKNIKNLNITAALGPQHGMRGEKQDNMIESDDYQDPIHKIPVFSLYGKVRRPTPVMLDSFDVVLVDLQDVGCRIYTFLTTLFYLLDAVDKHPGKEVWVLERPNPAGRPVEGILLDMNFASFVGAAPVPMRHGLTLGEAALWYIRKKTLKSRLKIVEMKNYKMGSAPGFGWPLSERSWVNPSPNMPRLSCARAYAGTVLLEGTKLSEGRGTTVPLEMFGAPKIDSTRVLKEMQRLAPEWLQGCKIRPGFYEPTFHKFKGELCSALQIHVDDADYDHEKFKPFRVISVYLKAIRNLYSDYDIWLSPPYEYEAKKMPIDILSGSSELRQWVDDPAAKVADWETRLARDEKSWLQEREEFLLYKG